MDFRLLGPLEIATDDGPADVGTGKRAALLIYLLLHANEVVSAERLIDEIWGEHPPTTAAKSVQVYVSQLRKALHGNGDLLVTRGSGYVLNVGDGELDVRRFEHALADTESALAQGDPKRAAVAARGALALWRGPALYDVDYESFAQAEAGRLEDLRLVALEKRIAADLELGKHAELVGELDALVAAHPLRERFRAQLMLALYRCGRQSEALEVYREGARLLRDELGLEPSPELRELEQKILVHGDGLAAVPVDRPPPPSHGGAPGPAPVRRRAAWLVVIGGALLALAAALALLERSGGSGGEGQARRGDTVVLIDPATAKVKKAYTVGFTPASVAVGAGSVWALNADDQTISQIDPKSGNVATFSVAATPTDLVAGAGALWVAAGTQQPNNLGAWADGVYRVDPVRDVVTARVGLPGPAGRSVTGAPGQLAVGSGAVWALGGGETLTRIDPNTTRVTGVIDNLRLRYIAVAGRFVWAIASDTTDVVQIDARTLHVRRRVHLTAAGLDAIAVGAGAVWAADSLDGTLWRIEPGATVTTRTVDVGVGADGVAVGVGGVWAINSVRGTLTRIDPRSRRVDTTISLGGTPRDVAFGAGGVWVADAGSAEPIQAATRAPGQRVLPRSACGQVQTAGGQSPDHVIVSDFPLDSFDAPRTQPMANAIAFVLRDHHFRAGRYRLGYQSCDDSTAASNQWDAGKCVANARAYAATPTVLGVIGPFNSGCALAELPILNRAHIPVVSPTNDVVGVTRPDPTAPRGSLNALYPTGIRNYVRLEPSEKAETAAEALLAKRLGLARVYVLDDAEAYGVRNATLFRAAARATGVPVVGNGHWDQNGKGYAALAARIRHARADGVYLGGFSAPPVGDLIRTLRARLGGGTALIGPAGLGPVDFEYEASHGAATGLYIAVAGGDAGVATADVSAASRRFVHDFSATQPGVPIDLDAVYTAASTEVLLDAIARSDGTHASVSRALLATRLTRSTIGSVSFDRNGDVRPAPVTILRVEAKPVSLVPYQTRGGVYAAITPPERLLR